MVAMVVPATAGAAALQISTVVPSTGGGTGAAAAVAAAIGRTALKKLVWVASPTNGVVGTHAAAAKEYNRIANAALRIEYFTDRN